MVSRFPLRFFAVLSSLLLGIILCGCGSDTAAGNKPPTKEEIAQHEQVRRAQKAQKDAENR